MAEGFVYGGQTILSHPIFVETILPFVLVFTIVFAFLQKGKVFGEGKKQIDAIVALIVGLLVISFAQATGYILQLVPFLAVSLVVILILLLLVGSFWKGELPTKLTYPLIGAVILAIVIAVVYVTNFWEYLYDWIYLGSESTIFLNVLFVVIIIAAVAFVMWAGGKAKSS